MSPPRPLLIRDEQPHDAAAVAALLAGAFGGEAEAALVARLRADGDAALSLVAENEGRIVGHILFSPLSAPFRALALAPLAVAADRRREGIGASLVRAGLARLGEAGWQGVFVLGDPAYYRRFGFLPELASGFSCVFGGPHLMALPLCGALPVLAGKIGYAPAFAGRS